MSCSVVSQQVKVVYCDYNDTRRTTEVMVVIMKPDSVMKSPHQYSAGTYAVLNGLPTVCLWKSN